MGMCVRDLAPAHARRPITSVSLIATVARRRTLIPRLEEAGIGCHVLLLQGDHEDVPPPPGLPVLPPLQSTLMIDTVGLTPLMQVRVLAELATRSAQVPTLLLTTPTNRLLHRLAASCPSVYAVVSDYLRAEEVMLWLRHPGVVGPARSPHVLPAYVDLPAPTLLIVDPQVLSILAALAHAPTIDAAARLCALPERTFYRKLRVIRTALHLPSRMYRGRASMLLQTILDALAGDRPVDALGCRVHHPWIGKIGR